MRHINQKGFTVIEVMFFILVIGLMVGGAYYVGTQKNKTDDNKQGTNQQSNVEVENIGWQKYKGDGYSLEYPRDWTFIAKNDQYPRDEFLPTADHETENNANSLPFETINTAKTASEYAKDDFPEAREDTVTSRSDIKINGYSAHTIKFTNPYGNGTSSGYQTYISHGDKVVTFFYYDNEEHFTTYEKIINSIKFK